MPSKALKSLPSAIELKSFLELYNVFKRFVWTHDRIVSLLNNNIQKNLRFNFVLNEREVGAMRCLQQRLISPSLLAVPYAEALMKLNTDACGAQAGFLLLPEQFDKTAKLSGYWSHLPTCAELVYNTMQRECLVIIWAVLLLRSYLEGMRFIIHTNSNSFKWILYLMDVFQKLVRFRLWQSKSDSAFKSDTAVAYRCKAKHHAAEALSRLRTDDNETTDIDEDLPEFNV